MSDERSSDPKLVLRAEALVAKFSTDEPDWEALEKGVTARLETAPALDEALLAAPFPEAEGESELDRLVVPKEPVATGAVSAEAPGSKREEVSLAALARASVARRGAREAASIAKESLAVATQSRALDDRVVERVKGPPAREAQARAGGSTARDSRGTTRDSRGPWIGVAIAAVGLAAGFGLYVAGQRRTPDVVVLPGANGPVANAPQAPQAAEPAVPALEARPSGPAPAPLAEKLDELPAASAEKSAPAEAAAAPERPAEPVAKSAPTGRPFGAGTAPERVVLEEDRPAGPAGGPAPARASKPTESAPLRPAELNPSGEPSDRPSSGAAQAAVGAVLGAARACIAGHSAPSSATLVFGSSGEVERVSVSGPAAGTPAAGCVESALKKARVQPFVADSFSLGVTVRPP
jgi:hypothetical protein